MKYLILGVLLATLLHAKSNGVNMLGNENSPYLQQHKHNPVNWYPWGKEALEKAKKEKKLIFLSIGYSTCHWCHVMENESFEDKDVARLLNKGFVSIKIDKETHPQIDKKYQQHYMKFFEKRGGWPLSVFLSPEGEVFHLATYIPKERGYGSKGMMEMLPHFLKTYKKNSVLFQEWITKYKEGLKKQKTKSKVLEKNISLEEMTQVVQEQYDEQNGGFAKRPKFPESSKINLLLDIYKLSKNKQALQMATNTLNSMAKSGIYDQIEGGFFRYTSDERWRIPHFEKMLYTNAELISTYSKAYFIQPNQRYKDVIGETIQNFEKYYMKNGLYFSASDADSKGEEGGYFIYSYENVYDALTKEKIPKEEIEKALGYFGIEEDGNIDVEFSHAHITKTKKPKYYGEVKTFLKNLRKKRVFPFIDRKIITSWNAMMIKALFNASLVDKKYLFLAEKRLEELYRLMWRDGVLYHQTLFGKKPKQKALLEDYAYLADAFVAAHQRTLNESYLVNAKHLLDRAIEKFYKNKKWFLSDDNMQVEADFDDRYYTSSLGVMLDTLLSISSLTEVPNYREIVDETIKNSAVSFQTISASSPKLATILLRLKHGDVMIHANRKKLSQADEKLNRMQYPFVLKHIATSSKYLACSVNSCFAADSNISRLIEKIERDVHAKRK